MCTVLMRVHVAELGSGVTIRHQRPLEAAELSPTQRKVWLQQHGSNMQLELPGIPEKQTKTDPQTAGLFSTRLCPLGWP